MKKVLCFGNPYLEEDSLALKLADELEVEGFSFVKCESFTDILEYKGKDELFILDVVKGITKPVLITDIDMLKEHSSLTLHDLDLAFNLKLLKEMNEISNVRIIGIPMKGNISEIKKDVVQMLQS